VRARVRARALNGERDRAGSGLGRPLRIASATSATPSAPGPEPICRDRLSQFLLIAGGERRGIYRG
jgi:hypothetical protein